jgi:hypothetical protein
MTRVDGTTDHYRGQIPPWVVSDELRAEIDHPS